MNLSSKCRGLVSVFLWILIAFSATTLSAAASASIFAVPEALLSATGTSDEYSETNDVTNPTALFDSELQKIALAPGLLQRPSEDGLPVIKVQNYPTNGTVILRVENPTAQALHVFLCPKPVASDLM